MLLFTLAVLLLWFKCTCLQYCKHDLLLIYSTVLISVVYLPLSNTILYEKYCHLFRVSEPEADSRKKDALTYLLVLGFTAVVTGYYKRLRFSPFKTRSISYVK